MRTIGFLTILVALALTTQAKAAGKVDRPWKRLDGTALKSALNDAELGDGAHYSYRFHADGNFDGTEMGKEIRGTWHTTAQALCWRWIRPPGREECYTVERKGRELRGLRDGYEAWWGELAPLKPATK